MSRITANYDKICFGVVSRKKQRSVEVYLGVHYSNYVAPECAGHAPSSGGHRYEPGESAKAWARARAQPAEIAWGSTIIRKILTSTDRNKDGNTGQG